MKCGASKNGRFLPRMLSHLQRNRYKIQPWLFKLLPHRMIDAILGSQYDRVKTDLDSGGEVNGYSLTGKPLLFVHSVNPLIPPYSSSFLSIRFFITAYSYSWTKMHLDTFQQYMDLTMARKSNTMCDLSHHERIYPPPRMYHDTSLRNTLDSMSNSSDMHKPPTPPRSRLITYLLNHHPVQMQTRYSCVVLCMLYIHHAGHIVLLISVGLVMARKISF
ncbi:hypothetical protein BO71DRAFT_487977 [Aspergillus ellipticus CBS 707.79]|uniref:Uncharacterized protein n=1 Tax=Aspergillus ellipticus CBS 707.79 TaxID=1448320 RepID=A0A319CVU8_9EURO|nr:hypothetical protein BO71DRAFT_487977 [Aspergillus ellipticus CBS 707.79]